MFLNVTNHPTDGDLPWSTKQRQAAEAIGGQVYDFQFPDVPPDASSADVVALADTLAERIVEMNPTAALVQGEFTLTVALVAQLERRGIPCYAATARRIASLTGNRDVSVETSEFRFVQFRRYALSSVERLGSLRD